MSKIKRYLLKAKQSIENYITKYGTKVDLGIFIVSIGFSIVLLAFVWSIFFQMLFWIRIVFTTLWGWVV